ncbi:unnamed protein product [Protopolystoma xenopodis]|uniref:FH2 domain-containing protein n=1 Tax=Protopolystoma xenopodis TaxID=117903 RepID=A0A448WAB0_9PLAT|nr:unnamed protein product [Protopolystoma xenopodis]
MNPVVRSRRKEFKFNNAEDQLKEVTEKLERLEHLRLACADYFCEERSQFKLEECIKIFKTFFDKFNKARQDNTEWKERQEKLQEKKRQEDFLKRSIRRSGCRPAGAYSSQAGSSLPTGSMSQSLFSAPSTARTANPLVVGGSGACEPADARTWLSGPAPQLPANSLLARRLRQLCRGGCSTGLELDELESDEETEAGLLATLAGTGGGRSRHLLAGCVEASEPREPRAGWPGVQLTPVRHGQSLRVASTGRRAVDWRGDCRREVTDATNRPQEEAGETRTGRADGEADRSEELNCWTASRLGRGPGRRASFVMQRVTRFNATGAGLFAEAGDFGESAEASWARTDAKEAEGDAFRRKTSLFSVAREPASSRAQKM